MSFFSFMYTAHREGRQCGRVIAGVFAQACSGRRPDVGVQRDSVKSG